MLLPMLGIYQEYVRNHHYSLQVLAEYKQKPEFNSLLRRYEEKAVCEARPLDTFLTYPMHQIPRYIITIHELLAHTPHDHVERKSLELAQSKLEELSQIMQDEVSETENIRKNLAIERMIVEGCDILLDVNQTFVRQGTLRQILSEKHKSARGRLGSFSSSFKESKKDLAVQVFLFTNHVLLTTRASNGSGRLHLAKNYGKISLIDCNLVEDSSSDIFHFDDSESASSYDSTLSLSSQPPPGNLLSAQSCEKDTGKVDYNGLDFRLIVDSKSGPPTTIILLAATVQEKAAWCSDISQCVENAHYTDLLSHQMSSSHSLLLPGLTRSDPKLFRDDVDIKFSRTLNSCKVPQIRHASVERLLDRLTDLRFLSIDFLNTFLLTYRVFTTGQTVLEALKRVYRNPECGNLESERSQDSSSTHRQSFDQSDEACSSSSPPLTHVTFIGVPPEPSETHHLIKPQAEKLRRISTGSMAGIEELSHKDAGEFSIHSSQSSLNSQIGSSFTKYGSQDESRSPSSAGVSGERVCHHGQPTSLLIPPKAKLAPIASCETLSEICDSHLDEEESELSDTDSSDSYTAAVTVTASTQTCSVPSSPPILPTSITFGDFPGESTTDPIFQTDGLESQLAVPGRVVAVSSETLIGSNSHSHGPSTSTSSDTLVPVSPRGSPSPQSSPRKVSMASLKLGFRKKIRAPPIKISSSHQLDALALSPATSPKFHRAPSPVRRATSPCSISLGRTPSPVVPIPKPSSLMQAPRSPVTSPKMKRAVSPISYSFSSPNIISNLAKSRTVGKRGSAESDITASSGFSPRSSFTASEGSPPSAKAGTVVTSSRASKRRSSSTAAAAAFAAATAGSTTPKEHPKGISRYHSAGPGELKPNNANKKRESVISTAATMRVLNVLRHWVSKHSQDFETDGELKKGVKDLLEEMVCNTSLLPAEHKAAASILHVLTKEEEVVRSKVDLGQLLTPPEASSKDSFDSLSALDIAEQLTYLDHKIFMAIRSEELLDQAWMKPDKAIKALHVLLVSKRFNEVSRLVVSEIIQRQNLSDRVASIEKWAAIADICRCMHNYNGVLQICAAFVNSSVYRLKKTWEKVSKQTKQMIERLQLLVSSDCRFKNMRDALHRCDPPAIPYLGMYLSDLSFIKEGTPNVTDEKLVNFSKMRMIAHVIREIQLYQQTPYKIEHHKRVTAYLLDTSRLLDEEETYKASLDIEPRQARVSMPNVSTS